MKQEIEATYLSIEKDTVRDSLRSQDFNLVTPEYMMRRKTFDFSKVAPGVNKWGRVRQESDKVTMTIKEVRGDGINDTYECELVVSDFDTASDFFEACNIPAKSYQENLREVWERSEVQVTIDTWPGLDPFVEVEGVSEDIVREVSQEIGFDFSNAVFGSIDKIYEKQAGIPAEKLITIPRITFEHPPKKDAE